MLAVLLALDYAGSLITFYIFYELVTLASFLLVVHSKTHEAVMAGLKYLFYSVAGAFWRCSASFSCSTPALI